MPSAHLLERAEAYWDACAETYERDFAGTLIGFTRRRAVWSLLDQVFSPGQRILELNCGTGVDAMHLAERGLRVLACDLSPRMIELCRARVSAAGAGRRVTLRALPTESIGSLVGEGPFDGVFSNFSGLNCVDDLAEVARNLELLLKPGAPALLCVMGRFVPWEVLWFLAHGQPRRAVRRFRTGPWQQADDFTVRVFSVGDLIRALGPAFQLKARRSIGIAVPPSYMEQWARRYPGVTNAIERIDAVLGRVPFVKIMGDCVLMQFERRAVG
jgi:SAM-dependent methyltransferase